MMRLFAARILNFTPDLNAYDTRHAIFRGFSVWSDVSTLEFHEVQTGPADILIEFASGYHHDGYPFDGEGRFSCVALDFVDRKFMTHDFYRASRRQHSNADIDSSSVRLSITFLYCIELMA